MFPGGLWYNDLCPCLQEVYQRLHNLLWPADDVRYDVRYVKDVQSLKVSGCTQKHIVVYNS
jgi:hypothetical protein